MRPRPLPFVALAVASGLALAACGGQTADVSSLPPDQGAEAGAPGPFATPVTPIGGGSGGGEDPGVPIGGELPAFDAGLDATVPPPEELDGGRRGRDGGRRDGGATRDGGDGGPVVCDADGDGVLGEQCGGSDCCDLDPDVKPGQTRWFARANRCGRYDFDCDGRSTRRYPEVACRSVAGSCAGEGFMGSVPCGTDGLWQTCEPSGPNQCAPGFGTGDTRTQECR